MLKIELPGGAHAFEPGERVRGHVHWKLDDPPPTLQLRLLWRTSGEAIPEEQGVVRLDWGSLPAAGEQSFEIDLPGRPTSAVGRFFRLDWFLELSVPDRGLVESIPLLVAGRREARDWSTLNGAPAPVPAAEAEADPQTALSGEAVVLRTRREEGWRFVVQMALLALAWNATWLCIAFGLGPIEDPAPGWAWLFLLPFALLGVLWLLMAGSGLLVCLGPNPAVRMPSTRWRPGEVVPIAWSIEPGRRPPRPWQITLEAREEVDTRVGGTRGRGERCFWRGLIAERETLEGTTEGAARVKVPADAVPSFESRHLAVRWILRFAAREARKSWAELPWMNKEFEIEVEPAGPATGAAGGPGWGS